MNTQEDILPGADLSLEKMPGHWLLARMGKRVLRPGGLELTRQMIAALTITATDHVVEFAPGLGVTAALALQHMPASYTGVEAEQAAAEQVQRRLGGEKRRCVVGRAEHTGLPEGSATVVYGEALLTMQTPGSKLKIVQEAKRLLASGGRYGIHELCLVPDDLDEAMKNTINQALSQVIHVGARPLTVSEWKTLLAHEGFSVHAEATAPMHLLELPRLLQDEGLSRTIRIAWNIMRQPAARRRVLAMRRVFRQYEHHLAAVMLVAERSA
jgi:cyclopropane fatty-acyl-phospholipid synthase-like methyltransferase